MARARARSPETEAQIREAYARLGSYAKVRQEIPGVTNNACHKAVQHPRGMPRDVEERPVVNFGEVHALVERLLAEHTAQAGAGKPEVVEQPTVMVRSARSNIVECRQPFERIAFVSDIHHPFEDKPALQAVFHALRDFKPQLLIIGGDFYDCFSISDHDREPGRMDCLQDEFDAARDTSRALDELGAEQVVFIAGNHEERIERIQRRNPGLFKLRALELPRAAEFPPRWLYYPDQTQLRIGHLTALHGNLKGRGTNMMHAAAGMIRKLRTTCIAGHLHRFQCFMETAYDGTVRAGFANGHLSDVNEARYISAPDWQQGCTFIDYNHHDDLFAVTPLLVVRSKVLFRGKTYG